MEKICYYAIYFNERGVPDNRTVEFVEEYSTFEEAVCHAKECARVGFYEKEQGCIYSVWYEEIDRYHELDVESEVSILKAAFRVNRPIPQQEYTELEIGE